MQPRHFRSYPRAAPVEPAIANLARAATRRASPASGILASRFERVLGLALRDEYLGQADDGLGTVGLELERTAQRGLVSQGDQLVGLARGRDEPAHEVADGSLAERADELVDERRSLIANTAGIDWTWKL